MGTRPVTCTATLAGEKSEHYFILPVDVHAAFGRHRPPVRVTLRGHTFRTTPARYGTHYYIVVNRSVALVLVGLPLLIAACQNVPGGPGY